MLHEMNLVNTAFNKILSGKKTIELRLFDEKRQKISIGDNIRFRNTENKNIIVATVKALHIFKTFEELYKALPIDKCGYEDTNTAKPDDMLEYYTAEQIEKYGVVGIELYPIYSIVDIKSNLKDKKVLDLLSYSVFNPTSEKLMKRAEQYIANEYAHATVFTRDEKYIGLCVFEIKEKVATILDIAVDTHERNKGTATALIDYIRYSFDTHEIVAETDDDAIGFYLKYGFVIAKTTVKFDTKRYTIKYTEVISHYDTLIDQNNDPVHDPEPLKAYMDKWDGQVFVDKMQLDSEKSVLEIGVGTGRLAIKTAPLCNEFYGIDISPKTTQRAKENLAAYKNVNLICGDFLEYNFEDTFDTVYSSLTFMHIEDKLKAICKVFDILSDGGIFVLSIDKSQDEFIDIGTSKIKIFPDTPENIAYCLNCAGFHLSEQFETEFAHIFVAKKHCKCYCGHDCSKCVTYIATKTDNNVLREQARSFYKNEFSQDIPLESFNCFGGRTENQFVLCDSCPFKKCCKEKNIVACDQCSDYPCNMLEEYQKKYVNKCNQIKEF